MTPKQTSVLRRILLALLGVFGLLQWVIFSDQAIFWPVSIVLATGSVVIMTMVRANVLRNYPISTIQVIGFWIASQGLALGATLVEGNPLVTNLKQPVWTFGASGLMAISLVLAHRFYRTSLPQRLRSGVTKRICMPLGVFRPPAPAQLWMIGLFGLLCLAAARVAGGGSPNLGGEGGGGGALYKLVHGLSVFSAAPFIIPFISAIRREDRRLVFKEFIPLIFFFVFIAVIGVAANTRLVVLAPIIVAVFTALFLVASGQLPLRAFKSRVWIAGGIVAIFLFGTATDFALAMQKARERRTTLSPAQMLALSAEIYSSPEMMEQFRTGALMGRHATLWDESYTSSLFVNRFITTKYHDLGLDLDARFNATDRDALGGFNKARIVAIFPAPLVNALPFGLRKSSLAMVSNGDFMFFLATGSGLGTFRTGSMVAQTFAMWQWLAYPIIAITAIFVFALSDSLVRRVTVNSSDLLIVSPVVLVNAFMFYNLFQGEGYDALLNFLFRGFWQTTLLYALLIWGTALITGVAKRPKRCQLVTVR